MARAWVGNAEGAEMKRKLKDSFSTGELAGLLGIMEPDEFEERLHDFAADEVYPYVYRDSEGTESEREEAATAAEEAYIEQEYEAYSAAVHVVAEAVFGEHGLKLVGLGTVVPEVSWRDAANKIRDTINGVGNFYFSSLREFLDSGPYTARQAVLWHLHWMRRRSDVYGTVSPAFMFERQMS